MRDQKQDEVAGLQAVLVADAAGVLTLLVGGDRVHIDAVENNPDRRSRQAEMGFELTGDVGGQSEHDGRRLSGEQRSLEAGLRAVLAVQDRGQSLETARGRRRAQRQIAFERFGQEPAARLIDVGRGDRGHGVDQVNRRRLQPSRHQSGEARGFSAAKRGAHGDVLNVQAGGRNASARGKERDVAAPVDEVANKLHGGDLGSTAPRFDPFDDDPDPHETDVASAAGAPAVGTAAALTRRWIRHVRAATRRASVLADSSSRARSR